MQPLKPKPTPRGAVKSNPKPARGRKEVRAILREIDPEPLTAPDPDSLVDQIVVHHS